MKHLVKIFLIIVAAISLSACFAGKTSPQLKYLFAVHYPKQQAKQSDATLYVRELTALPQFATNEFVYRVTQFRYQPDYYHVFLVPAAEQISQATETYLMRKGLFNLAYSNLTPAKNADYILTGELLGLYADYRNSQQPRAVLKVRYIFYDNQKKHKKVLFDKVFTEAVPLQAKTSKALLMAWNQGLTEVLKKLTYDVAGIVKD